MKLDVIGDIHGHADELISLLRVLGYCKRGDVYYHPDRAALFIGDYIDRGPRNLETVQIIRSMVEANAARAIMGNHEYNALGYHTRDDKNEGGFLREHSEKNRKQHEKFLEEMSCSPHEAEMALKWFRNLPLFIEEEGVRFVHAAWHQPTIDKIKPLLNPDFSMPEDFLRTSFQHGTNQHAAIEMLLKGPEHELPEGIQFEDKDGYIRRDIRLAWWKTPPLKFKDGAVGIPDETGLPDHDIPCKALDGFLTGEDAPIVFFGHYWNRGVPSRFSAKNACVDYSVAKGGALCCYRWEGESELREDRFVTFPDATIVFGNKCELQ